MKTEGSRSKIASVAELVTENMPEVTTEKEGAGAKAANQSKHLQRQQVPCTHGMHQPSSRYRQPSGPQLAFPAWIYVAFYKKATPHKMGGISAECTVPMGSMLEVNLLLLDH